MARRPQNSVPVRGNRFPSKSPMQTLSIVDRRGADTRLLSTSENEIRQVRAWLIVFG